MVAKELSKFWVDPTAPPLSPARWVNPWKPHGDYIEELP
jgi:hypothetical protein